MDQITLFIPERKPKAIFAQMERKGNKFIVAIGASAGGLKPIQTFFDRTPNDHATYIILRHLHPDFTSMMADILKKHCKLEIVEAENATLIDQNKVYTLPENMYMTILDDHLYLKRRNEVQVHPNIAIDIFLQSLAKAKGPESIAVILSGMGSDGANGAKKIKEKGGMVIAQSVQSCEYSSMPANAIRTGAVDYELLPEEMPDTILNHINKWIKNNEDK
jgi:two-component system CheB/CheR fusion protein